MRRQGGNNQETMVQDFLGGSVVKNLPANAEDMGSNPSGGSCIGHGATKKKKIIIPSGGLYFLTSSEPNYLPKFPPPNTSC